MHRLRPEAGDHVQREADEPERRVARAGCAGACETSTSSTETPVESTSAFVNFCRPIAPNIGSIASRR